MIDPTYMISGGFTLAGAIVGALFVLAGMLAWYFVCKYFISSASGCRYDQTNMFFTMGLIVVIIIFVIIHLLSGGF